VTIGEKEFQVSSKIYEMISIGDNVSALYEKSWIRGNVLVEIVQNN